MQQLAGRPRRRLRHRRHHALLRGLGRRHDPTGRLEQRLAHHRVRVGSRGRIADGSRDATLHRAGRGVAAAARLRLQFLLELGGVLAEEFPLDLEPFEAVGLDFVLLFALGGIRGGLGWGCGFLRGSLGGSDDGHVG